MPAKSGAAALPFASVIDTIFANAARWPDRDALIHDEGAGPLQQLRYGELAVAVARYAAALHARGWAGQRIALLFAPGIDIAVAVLACLAAGAVAVPIAPTGRRRERVANVATILRDCTPAALLHDAVMARQYGAELATASAACGVALHEWRALPSAGCDATMPSARATDLAILQYTSGSTSRPKAVMITHGNVRANQEMIQAAFGHDAQSRFVGWAPHFHDQGLFGNILQPLFLGTTAVIASPATFIQRPLTWLELIHRYGAHTSGGPDFAYALCVEHAERRGLPAIDLSGWKVAFNGAEPIREQTMARFAACFAPLGFRADAFLPCYGLAECTLLATGRRSSRPPILRRVETGGPTTGGVRAVCCGPAVDRCTLRIVDAASGIVQPDGTAGEIWLGGPHVAAGYWQQPEQTKDTFGAMLPTGEGPFLRTGDIGMIAPEGLYVIGRLKDLIIVRGRNFAPSDLEHLWEQLADRAGPAASAAVQIEHDGRSHVVLVAEMDRAAGPDPAATVEIDRWSAALRQAAMHRLDLSVSDLMLVPPATIPRTTSGKVRRAAVRQAIVDGVLPIMAAAGPLSGLRNTVSGAP